MNHRRTLVVIPTYNEAQTIVAALDGLALHVPWADVLVVDDGSPDGTADLVETHTAADQGRSVSVLRRDAKEGLGKAYVAGFTWAQDRGYQTLVEMDADGSHRPEDLPKLLELAGEADLVIGSRWVRGGSVVNWPLNRLLLSRLANIYTRIALGLAVRDATAGFRAYDADLLARIPLTQIASQGYGFQIDMTVRARDAGATIREVPIVFVERTAGVSKMSGHIIGEALVSVARWGLTHRARQLTRLVRRSR